MVDYTIGTSYWATRQIYSRTFWRSLFGMGALSLNFASLTLLTLPEVTALEYAAPLLTVLLAI